MVIVGLMSGTSLDGLDIAACKFWMENERWKFEIIHAQTIEYKASEIDYLKNAFYLSGVNLIALHHQYGNFLGDKVKEFCKVHSIKPDYIASHGHTIFHQPNTSKNTLENPHNPNPQFTQPESNNSQFTSDSYRNHNTHLKGFTFQLGHGANIAVQSRIKTICDFRTTDVAYGGQGAPLVPIGDELLFPEYDYCLNLGGISNISYNENTVRKAFDIGVCNMALNQVAEELNLSYDKDGIIASGGNCNTALLEQLKDISKINHLQNHSLGYEWYHQFMEPVICNSQIASADKLRTLCEFIAGQIAAVIKSNGKILVTGGGAKNKFLMKCIEQKSKAEIITPNASIIDYKEALIFAFLGLLRVNEQPNSLKAVTGALKNNIGGCIYLP